MNEIQLSDSLPVIETEIRQYQNLAGESIFEIGRRLKHVKENDLVHGQWSKWCETINMSSDYANKHIKVYEEFNNKSTSTSLPFNSLYEMATLPEPERTKEHVTENGETKTPDEMTVRELRELKKQLKQRDEENNLLQSKLEDAENREPEVIERYSEPEDYEDVRNMNDHLSKEREYYKNLADDFRKEIKDLTSFENTNEVQKNQDSDQTAIIILSLMHVEKILDNDSISFDKNEVEEHLLNLLKKVEK